MSDEAAFLKTIKQNPKDTTARLAFSDWLQDRDDPRAAWVRDDDIWKWMKPDAKPPVPRILTAFRQDRRVPVEVLRKLSPGIIPDLLKALATMSSWSAEPLHNALQALGPVAEPAMPTLLKALQSDVKRVRIGAFRCLTGLAATNAAAREQVHAGLSHEDGDIRELAARAVRKAPGTITAPQLIEIVRQGDRRTFATAIASLEKMGPLDHSLIPDLMELRRRHSDADWEISEEAKEALARIGLPAVRPLLESARGMNDLSDFNMEISDTIDEMKVDTAALYRIFEEVINTGSTPAARHLAAATWHWVEPKCSAASLPWIIAALRGSDDVFRESACSVIEWLGPVATPALPTLLELAHATRLTWYDRTFPIDAIGWLGAAADPAIPALFAFLEDIALAPAATRALFRLGRGPSAVVTILSLAARTGARTGDPISALNLDKKVSEDAADVQHIYKAYQSRNANNHLTEPARLAVAKVPDVVAISAHLEDASVAKRLVAVFALQHVGTPEAVEGLLAALKDKDKLIRTNAVRAIGAVGTDTDDVRGAIRGATKDKAKVVCAAAKKARTAIKGRS